ncbi:MAG: insulinase family protein [Treponema sp.]|jgi:zinc protease|nr:insulinase family protein [Treponema sp.]
MKTKSNLLIKITRAAGFVVLTAVLIAACSSLSGDSSAAWGNLGQPSDQVPFMEKVRTGTLPSGLRYYILENSMPENRAYLTLAVKAGSVLEEDDERGLAHFVEHMAFNGTERFPESKLVNYLRSLGMRFGPEVNAYTSFDQTVYGIEVPVEKDGGGIRRIPETALAVIDDWTRAVVFSPADVNEERPVIMEEYRTRLGAWERIRQKWLPVLFRGSPYADRMPIGLPEIIQGAPASRLEGFYKKWYKADNMALIFVGDFDGAALEASLADHFRIQKPAAPTDLPLYDLLPPKKGNVEVLTLTDPELTNTNIYLYFKRGHEAPREDLSFFRSEIIDILIDRMLSFRFEDALTKPETPYVYAGAGSARYGASSRFYVMMAQAKTGSAEASLVELLREKEAILRYGFSKETLENSVNAMLSDARRLVQEKDRQESNQYVNLLTRYYLEGGNLAGIEWELEALQQLLPRIKAKDINAAIRDYFAGGDVQVFVFAPDAEQANLPGEERIRQIVSESGKMKAAQPKYKNVRGDLVSRIPAKGSVIAESTDVETGAVLWELNNGAKVILKSTKNKNDEIVMQAMARGGTSSAAPEDGISARLAVEMTQVSGLGPWPRSDLSRKLDGKQVSFSYSVDGYYRNFRGSATSGDLKTLFEMLYLSFTDPRINPVAVQAMMDQYKTSLALRGEDPHAVFSDEINRTIYSGHPRFKPLELDDLAKANIDAALVFIRKGLNPADYTFVFTGNLDLKKMREYAESYLAPIPRGESWNTWADPGVTRPGKVEKIVYKGKEEQSTVYMAWFSKAPYSDELSAISQVLNEYIDIKLDNEIREKLGGVYSISSGVSVSPVPQGELVMQVYFNCDPKRVRELQTAVIAVLNQITGGAIDRDIFTKAGEALKKEWEVSIQSNSYIAQSYANSSVLLNLPLSRLDRRPKLYEAVTPADIQRVCGQLLQSGGPALVVLMPEGAR